MFTASELIALLDLKPLPREGGYYRETYRADNSLSTAMYYLLAPDTFSAMHRLPSDEVFHFYLGSPVTMLLLSPEGGKVITLGNDLRAGQVPQYVVPGGIWQGSFTTGPFALLGTTVAPGFHFKDYEHGDRAALMAQYPQFAELIARLTTS